MHNLPLNLYLNQLTSILSIKSIKIGNYLNSDRLLIYNKTDLSYFFTIYINTTTSYDIIYIQKIFHLFFKLTIQNLYDIRNQYKLQNI